MKKPSIVLPVLMLLLLFITIPLHAQDYSYYNNLAKKEYGNKNYYTAIDYATRSLNASLNGEAYWWRGMSRYYLENYLDAITDFTSALSYYSSDRSSLGELYIWRGDCRRKQRLYQDAISDYELSLSYGSGKRLHIYWSEAAAYYNSGEYQKAVDMYTSAINNAGQNTDLAKLYKERGDASGALYKYDDAIADFSKAIEYDSRYTNAFWQRGYYRGKKLQYELAIGDFTAAIRLLELAGTGGSNDLSVLYNNRGHYRYYLGNYEEAKTDLEQSLNQNPNYDYANWNMGRVLAALHRYKEARTYYLLATSLMKKEVDRASCYADLYWSDRSLLDYGQALVHINEAIRLNPYYRGYLWNRAYLFGLRKEYANALDDYKKVVNLYSSDTNTTSLVSLYIEMGLLKSKMKDYAGGLKDLQKAVELDASNHNAYYELGRFFKEVMKQTELAAINLQKAAGLSVLNDTTSSYAYAKAVKGDRQEAVRVIETLLRKETTDNELLKWELHNAACIHALTGNLPKAMAYLEQSLVAGYDNFDHLVNDRDLEVLKQLPAYRLMLTKYNVPVPKY